MTGVCYNSVNFICTKITKQQQHCITHRSILKRAHYLNNPSRISPITQLPEDMMVISHVTVIVQPIPRGYRLEIL